jgi:octopine/nopaline transport system permease protein
LLSGVPLSLNLAFFSIWRALCSPCCGADALGYRRSISRASLRLRLFGTPLLVQIFLLYYGLGQFPGFAGLSGPFCAPYWCALLALTLNTAAYSSEIIARDPVRAFRPDRGGAGVRDVAGLIFRRITVPQDCASRSRLRRAIILMTRSTALAS